MRLRVSLAILLVVSVLAACSAPPPAVVESATQAPPMPTLEFTQTPTATPTATPEETATPTATSTKEPTDTPEPPPPPTEAPTPKPTEKLAPGDQDIGTEFRLKSKKAILEELNKPENKNKIILPVTPGEESTITYYKGIGADGDRFIYMTIFNPANNNIYYPTNNTFTLGGLVNYNIGFVQTTDKKLLPDHVILLSVAFGTEKKSYAWNPEEDALGQLITDDGAVCFGYFNNGQPVGHIVIKVVFDEKQDWSIEGSIARYFKDVVVLSEDERFVGILNN